jgi:hypothetical protein
MLRFLVAFFLLVRVLAAAEFDPRRDAFAFSNETVLSYEVDAAGRLRVTARTTPAHLTHRCICFTRAVMQFWQFARFEPRAPRLAESEYRSHIQTLFRIPVWSRRSERIVLPGYANLWEFSKANQRLIESELGSWQLTYLRPGNWRMANPLVRSRQRQYAEELFDAVSNGRLQAMYLAKFPSMNHAVIVYSAKRLPGGGFRFRVYDSNYAGTSARLDYDPAKNLFDFEPRYYWPGGPLRAFPIYTSPFN